MSETVDRIVSTQAEAHAACLQVYALAKMLLPDGKRVHIVAEEDLEGLSVKQRKFLHGPVLGQIAEQVRMPDGTRYVAKVWKEYFRDLFLPTKWVVERRPKWDPKLRRLVQGKRATPRQVKASTEDLNVKQYSEFIEKVLAHATSELGVVFELDPIERDGVRYVSKRAAKASQQERRGQEA